MNRTFYSINWKDKKYFVVSETETYLLVSANGKDKLFSILRNDAQLIIPKPRKNKS